jgi:hypothetical protein
LGSISFQLRLGTVALSDIHVGRYQDQSGGLSQPAVFTNQIGILWGAADKVPSTMMLFRRRHFSVSVELDRQICHIAGGSIGAEEGGPLDCMCIQNVLQLSEQPTLIVELPDQTNNFTLPTMW